MSAVVGILCNLRRQQHHRAHLVSEKYVAAVEQAAGAVPMLIPALGDAVPAATLLDRLDGLVLTGGASNIDPARYGGPPFGEGADHDPARDGASFALIREAIARGLPLLAICRGLQEMNVALGGSLHQRLWQVPGRTDHRRERDRPIEDQYRPRQTIRLTPGGRLAALAGHESVQVNSLHGQGIDRLADGLSVEAVAEDGTIEAVSVREARGFALGVQWHPEFRPLEHPLYRALFQAFGEAAGRHCRARGDSRAQAAE